MTFHLQQGTNISEWLSQSERRGAERAAFFTSADVRWIAGLGLDHIRIPVDEVQMWDEQGKRDLEAFSLLDAALDWAEQFGLRAVVDLHILRTHYFVGTETPRLFTDPAETERFAGLWADLSNFLCRRSNTQVAYELLNEAVASDPQDWNRVAMAAYQALRAREPERTIVLGSNRWNSYSTFDVLDIPSGDPNLILTFHYYHPMLITHYCASWWEGGVYDGPTHYPGRIVDASDLAGLDPVSAEIVRTANREEWSRERMAQDIALPVEVARRFGYPLYCGEFGAYHRTPLPLREAWYRDIRAIFEEHGISWANWDYKGGFAPLIRDGEPSEIVEVLLG